MSTTILGGDVTVYFLDENRQKRLKWSGSATGTRSMNELYSACADLVDEDTTMDDASVMSAETPTEYTIGNIDAGAVDPWYISYEMMQHMTGGSLQTSGWTHSDGSATGLIVVPVTSNNILDTDEGYDISGASTGNGTLLEVIDLGGSTDYLVIRPDSNAAGDNFTTDTQVITCNAHTASQSGSVSNTGEQVWPNLYSLGTIESDTHLYVYQGLVSDASRARVVDITDSTQDWWSDGHIDRCFYQKDFTDPNFATIDGGYYTVLARKYGTLYDNYEVLTTASGGRNPIPLATAPDLDNPTGYQSITTTAVATDDFSVGDEIEGASSGARAIITAITGTSPTYTFHYYLIDDPLTTFNTTAETINNNDSSGEATKDTNAPAAQGPALSTWYTSNSFPTVTFGNTTYDIDDDGTAEGYGATLNCMSNPLDEVYEWIKYTYRRGNTTTTNGDGIECEQYVGATAFLNYAGAVSGTIAEGSDVQQETTLATGIVISHDTTLKEILLRDTRGTFATGYAIYDLDTSGNVYIDLVAANFAAKKAAPLGTYAGGTLFGARGILLSNWISADENSFTLTSSDGVIRERPVAISITVTNLRGTDETTATDDHVAAFRLTGSGGQIDKTEHSAAGGESAGDTTLVVDTAIGTDVPGKTTGGVLHLRDADDNNQQYRLRFSSWSTATFTLANIDVASADAGTNTTTVVEAGAFANAKRGDLVYNHDQSAVSYVKTVDSSDQITIDPAITNQDPGDHIELNCIPISVNTADDVYVALIDQYATSSQASVSIVYVAPIYYRVKVRNTRGTLVNETLIKPFVTDDSTSGTDRSTATIRTPDTIYS